MIDEFIAGKPFRYNGYATATFKKSRGLTYLSIRPDDPNLRKYELIMGEQEARDFYRNNPEV